MLLVFNRPSYSDLVTDANLQWPAGGVRNLYRHFMLGTALVALSLLRLISCYQWQRTKFHVQIHKCAKAYQ
jgi:hypothetical protein